MRIEGGACPKSVDVPKFHVEDMETFDDLSACVAKGPNGIPAIAKGLLASWKASAWSPDLLQHWVGHLHQRHNAKGARGTGMSIADFFSRVNSSTHEPPVYFVCEDVLALPCKGRPNTFMMDFQPNPFWDLDLLHLHWKMHFGARVRVGVRLRVRLRVRVSIVCIPCSFGRQLGP